MSELPEQQLRAAFAARLERLSPDREARLRAFDYRPRRRGHRLLAWPTIAAVTTAAAAAIVVAVAMLSSGVQAAFAGWTRTPARLTASALAAARTACGAEPGASVLAAEARGPYSAIVYTRHGEPWQCVASGRRALLNESTTYPPSVVVKPGAGRISLPYVNQTVWGTAAHRLRTLDRQEVKLFDDRSLALYHPGVVTRRGRKLQAEVFAATTGADSLTAASGYAGAGVTHVTFVLRDGTHVGATVGRGWYLAWWPGSDRRDATDPVAIRVSTAVATRPAPYSAAFLSRYYHPCALDSPCLRYQASIIPGVAPGISDHFRLFRDAKPSSPSDLPKSVRDISLVFGRGPLDTEPRFGLDVSQLRAVSFGDRGTVWVAPGNEGLCWTIVYPGFEGGPTSGPGGCSALSTALTRGAFIFGSQSIEGVVPDGNSSVTVRLRAGRRVSVPVKQNVVFAQFNATPQQVILRNAYGKRACWPLACATARKFRRG